MHTGQSVFLVGFASSPHAPVTDVSRINPSEAACHPHRCCFTAPEPKQGLELPQPQEQSGLDRGAEQERIQVVFCKMAVPLNPRALYTT